MPFERWLGRQPKPLRNPAIYLAVDDLTETLLAYEKSAIGGLLDRLEGVDDFKSFRAAADTYYSWAKEEVGNNARLFMEVDQQPDEPALRSWRQAAIALLRQVFEALEIADKAFRVVTDERDGPMVRDFLDRFERTVMKSAAARANLAKELSEIPVDFETDVVGDSS